MTAGLLGEETGGIMLTHSDKAAACDREVQKDFHFTLARFVLFLPQVVVSHCNDS
jgi:hypothetical protein